MSATGRTDPTSRAPDETRGLDLRPEWARPRGGGGGYPRTGCAGGGGSHGGPAEALDDDVRASIRAATARYRADRGPRGSLAPPPEGDRFWNVHRGIYQSSASGSSCASGGGGGECHTDGEGSEDEEQSAPPPPR